jgi:NADH dehydrogenase FAD-containing subunit
MDFFKDIDIDERVFTPKPIENLIEVHRRIVEADNKSHLKIVVAGAGADGVEFAGNFWKVCHEHGIRVEIMLITSGKLLSQFHPRARTIALKSLERRDILVVENEPVIQYKDGQITTRSGKNYHVDIALFTVGIRPAQIFVDSELPTDNDGALLVNRYLQSVAHPEIFGGGDCINLEDVALDKVGVYATRQSPVLLHNLMATIEEKPLVRFEKTGPYQLIFNMGDGSGIYCRENIVWAGTLAFIWKNAIDQKFMRTFQVSGEGNESD